jgi:beta-N-acetylhexosaminidase
MRFGDFNDLLLVRDVGGKIVGTVIMFSPLSNSQRLDVPWKRVLGENSGALGCVGIARSLHGQGLGSAMMAAAMEELKKRGVRNCHIGWTWRVTFYENLGFKLWQSFRMSWRNLL